MRPSNLLFALLCFASVCTAPPDQKTIDVTGKGKIKVVPDMVELSLTAYTEKPAMKDVVAATQGAVREMIAVCGKYVVDPADVKVSSISTNKAYEYRNGKE